MLQSRIQSSIPEPKKEFLDRWDFKKLKPATSDTELLPPQKVKSLLRPYLGVSGETLPFSITFTVLIAH